MIASSFEKLHPRAMKHLLALLAGVLFSLAVCTEARAFEHPSIPPTVKDLEVIKANLNVEPWKSGQSFTNRYRTNTCYITNAMAYGLQLAELAFLKPAASPRRLSRHP